MHGSRSASMISTTPGCQQGSCVTFAFVFTLATPNFLWSSRHCDHGDKKAKTLATRSSLGHISRWVYTISPLLSGDLQHLVHHSESLIRLILGMDLPALGMVPPWPCLSCSLQRLLLGPGASPSNPVDNFGPSSGGLWDFSSSRSSSHIYQTDTLACLRGLVHATLGFFSSPSCFPSSGFTGGMSFLHPCLCFSHVGCTDLGGCLEGLEAT